MFVMRCFHPFNFSGRVSLHKQAGRGGKGEKKKKEKGKGAVILRRVFRFRSP